MKPENETCIAQLKVKFDLGVDRGSLLELNSSKLSAWIRKRIGKKGSQKVNDLQEWSRLKTERRKRAFDALDCLCKLSPDWQVEVSAKKVIALNLTLDPRTVYKALRSEGYSESEFEIEVEYIRKWGVL